MGSSPGLVESIVEASAVVAYGHRDRLFQVGQPADRVFMVLGGQVQIFRGDPESKHAVLFVMQPGDPFALRAVLKAGRYTETAEAIGSCRVLEVPAAVFFEAIERDPVLARRILDLVAKRLQAMCDQFERVQLMTTSQRLADYILRLAPADADVVRTVLPMEKGLIATYLGMEPESLSRSLKKLRQHGIACEGREVRISDRDALQAFVSNPEV